MKSVIDSAFSRSRTVLASLVLILIAGTVAFVEIPKESEPDINIPIIYVSMTHEGISPEDAERLLIRPMEEELRAIEGVKEMKSTGYEGGANVILEFEAGFDADAALADVRERVDMAKPELPAETDEPTVNEVNFSLFPVLAVTLSGQVPERTLVRLARDLQNDIEGISSVLKAEIAGDRDEIVEILIDPVRVESYGLTPADAIAAVKSSNLLVAAGAQDTGHGRFSVKVPGLYETVYDVISQPVKVSGDAVVRLGDIADIRRTFKDPESFARLNGNPAVVLEVSKRSGENIIDTIAKVRQVIAQEQTSWPEGLRDAVTVSYSQDKSNQVRNMLTDLQNNVISAVILVMVVVVAALGMRSSALVGVAIPGSFLTAILLLYSLGLTVNMVVLFSLILAVGMLVDGAIVVTEYADRKMTEGEPRHRAYAQAAKRMSWPIIASTATTLAAFFPLLFWPGVVGEFMKYLPLTLLATLSASLLMALVFVPTLGSKIGKPGAADPKTMRAVAAGESGENLESLGGFTGGYVKLLKASLRFPSLVLIGALVILVGSYVAYGKFGKGVEFFPAVEPEFAKLQVRARGNLSIWEKDALMRQVEDRILALNARHGEFKTIYARTGKDKQSQEAEDIIGTIALELTAWDKRRKAAVILEEARAAMSDLAGIYVDPREEEQGPPVGKPVQVQLSSRFPDLLIPAVEKVLHGFEEVGGLTNVEDSRPLPGIDWELKVDRSQAAKFGADVNSIGRAIQMVTTGIKLGEYRPDDSDDEIELRARYPREYRTIEQLDNVRISTPAGPVPINNFVKRVAKPRVGTINRTDGRRQMTVKADLAPGVLADTKVKELTAWLAQAGLDPRIEVTFKGEDEEQKKAQSFLVKAFGVALFIMALILVTQFNSFYSAFLILSAVVMSTVGVLLGLLATAQPFGIVMGGIGVIALAGIVVNNNIVLIDTYDHLKGTANSAMEAILRTGAQRLRPVMLTTVTTILGLMPMVFRVNIDFTTRAVSVGAPATQWWTQLATAIVFGLGFATVLTLVVTPSALMVRANLHDWRHARRLRRADRKAARAAAKAAKETGAGATGAADGGDTKGTAAAA
ncbi:MAG: efflux RND transporter permease subunit [Hyphomicrobiales bacterium]|nr:efflux RND transporter permease subunit [Hyphomicrobiales bacterium]